MGVIAGWTCKNTWALNMPVQHLFTLIYHSINQHRSEVVISISSVMPSLAHPLLGCLLFSVSRSFHHLFFCLPVALSPQQTYWLQTDCLKSVYKQWWRQSETDRTMSFNLWLLCILNQEHRSKWDRKSCVCVPVFASDRWDRQRAILDLYDQTY